jgi:hypothetical protein
MDEPDKDELDKLTEQIRKYKRALEKAAEYAIGSNEEVAYLTAIADVIAAILSAIPMKASYSGEAVQRAKDKGISQEEAFNEIFLDMLKRRIKEAQEERKTSSAVLLGLVDILKGLGKDVNLSKEVLDKLERYAGPGVKRTDVTDEPELDTVKGLDVALEAILKAKEKSRSDNTDGKENG